MGQQEAQQEAAARRPAHAASSKDAGGESDASPTTQAITAETQEMRSVKAGRCNEEEGEGAFLSASVHFPPNAVVETFL